MIGAPGDPIHAEINNAVYAVWAEGRRMLLLNSSALWSLGGLCSRSHTAATCTLWWGTREARYTLPNREVKEVSQCRNSRSQLLWTSTFTWRCLKNWAQVGNLYCRRYLPDFKVWYLYDTAECTSVAEWDSIQPVLSGKVFLPLKFSVKMMKSTKMLHK